MLPQELRVTSFVFHHDVMWPIKEQIDIVHREENKTDRNRKRHKESKQAIVR